MTNRQNIVHTFGSTKWEWRLCKVRDLATRPGDRASGDRRAPKLRSRRAQVPLTITVRYRGGPEASWLIDYRGRSWRVPGHLSVHDALSALSMGSSFNGLPAIATEP
jgi:hypothetical protein